MPHVQMSVCLQRPEEYIRSFGARVTGSCEPPDILLGTQLSSFERAIYTLNC